MLNLTKMNLYRLCRSKLFYSIVAILFLMVTLVTNMELDLEEQALKEQFIEEYGVDTEEAGSTPGITFNANYGERVGLGDVLVGNAGSGLAVLLVSIFVVIFADAERKGGFLKTLQVGQADKKYVFASKTIVFFVVSAVMMAVTLLATLVGFHLAHRSIADSMTAADVGDLALYLLKQILLHTAFSVFCLTLYELIRNSNYCLLIVIFTSLGVLTWLVAMLEGKLAAISPFMEKIIARLGLSQYMIVTRISGLKLYPVFPYVSSLVVAVIGIAVYLTLGMLIHCKRDTI